MKTKIKRHSRAVMSVILAVSMLISCMTVGLIATDAANVTGSDEEIGATDYYMFYNNNNSASPNGMSSAGKMTYSNGKYTGTLTCTASTNFFVLINTANNTDACSIKGGTTITGTGTVNSTGNQGYNEDNYSYNLARGASTVGGTITVTWDPSSNKVTLSNGSSSGGSCSTDGKYLVIGSKHLTGLDSWSSDWNDANNKNKLVYDSDVKCYKVVYKNVAISSTGFLFRITSKGNWDTNHGWTQATVTGTASPAIHTASSGEDNNISMTLSAAANITIYFDDSKSGTDQIQVVVTPAVSTVTAGTGLTGGTVTVNGGASATNIEYGGSVTLAATPAQYYHFGNWEDNNYLNYASATSASTTATVLGTTTVNAVFVKDSYNVSRGSGTGYTITVPNKANTSVQWGETVNVTAQSDSANLVDYLYYLDNNNGTEHKITEGTDGSGNKSELSGLFTMPKNNVTVYAHVHPKQANVITYGVCTGQTGWGYVNVGKQHDDSTSQIDYTIDSGDPVLEDVSVLFGARPAAGYKFVGWFDNEAGSDDPISTSQDYATTGSSGNYFAKFAQADIEAFKPASDTIRILIRCSDSDKMPYLWAWNPDSTSTNYTGGSWPGAKFSSLSTSTDTNGKITSVTNVSYKPVNDNESHSYIQVDFKLNKLSMLFNAGSSDHQTANIEGMTNGNVYVLTYDGDTTATKDYWKSTGDGVDPDIAATTTYPVKLYVNNPDKGYVNASDVPSTYVDNYFVAAGSNCKFYANPDDYENMKTQIVMTAGSGAADTQVYTSTSSRNSYKTKAMAAEGTTATVTFIDKAYYKVTYSAGSGGTLRASIGTANGTAVASGTMVQEGKTVVFTAEPANGYDVAGWSKSANVSGNATAATQTVTNIAAEANARVYFSKSKGTSNTVTYFGYSSTGSNPGNSDDNWSFITTYVSNGHVFAYINSPSANTTYFFQAYYGNPDTTEKKYKNMYYYDKSGTNTSYPATQFTGTIKDLDKEEPVHYQKTCPIMKFRVSSSATDLQAIKIDLGPEDSSESGKARPDLAGNLYQIIPIYNTDASKVTVYAKDGSYRASTDHDYFPGIADTVISSTTGVSNIKAQTEFETAVAVKGSTVTVTTTIDADHRKAFFIRGFSFNGYTPQLLDPNPMSGSPEDCSGVYTSSYQIPEDFDADYLEITPIYYYRHTKSGDFVDSNMVSFYIENYDKAIEDLGWGNTLSVYPYYQNASGAYVATKHNAFGGYPGQPVIYHGGRRFIEIPIHYHTFTVDNGDDANNNEECFIKGMTLSNDYFDIVHRDYCQAVDKHLQTYDYDDFYKIAQETKDGKEVNKRTTTADQITFAFKYRDTTNNFDDNTNYQTYSNTGNATVSAPYADFTLAEKTSKFGNGWEPLLDYHDRPVDLFGRQLTTEEQEKQPVLVVSDDYAINYVGCYATTWTVYVWDSNTSTYKNKGEIPPSALIVSEADRLDEGDGKPYPKVADTKGRPEQESHALATYKTVYQALEAYRGFPVEITYESAIKNDQSYEKYWSGTFLNESGSSEVSTRNDGRWFYSYEGEYINANLKIEYKNAGDPDSAYQVDTFKEGTNKGAVTGATVQFNNTLNSDDSVKYALDGYRDTADYNEDHPDNKIVSNQNDFFNFEATAGAGYIFAGWWFERDGVVTNVNDDLTQTDGSSQMTSNATFVARYIKNPSGSLLINHSLATGSEDNGTDTLISVKAINKSTNDVTWLTDPSGDHFVEDSFAIDDPQYMSYKSGYKFEITLKTIAGNKFTLFDRFTAGEGSEEFFSTDNQLTSPSADASKGTTTTTSFMVDIDDLFVIQDNFPKQTKEQLDYYSYLTLVQLKYFFTYKYKSKLYSDMDKNSNDQKFVVKGTFTEDELNKYVITTTYTTDDGHSGEWYKFGTNWKEFVASKCPYEKNIRQDLTWDFSNSSKYHLQFYYNEGQFKFTMDATTTEQSTKRVQFNLPYYAMITDNGCKFYSTDQNKRVVEISPDAAPSLNVVEENKTVTYSKYLYAHTTFGSVYAMNGASAENPQYVTAPDKLYNADYSTVKYFQYWSVQTVPAEVEIGEDEYGQPTYSIIDANKYRKYEIAKCYNLGFNFSLYQDYIVEPVYGTAVSTREHANEATITFVENGRNQWESLDTNEPSGGNVKDTWKYWGDRILSNFIVGFDRADKEMLKEHSGDDIKVGVVVEKLDTIQDANQRFGEEANWETKSEKWYNQNYGTLEQDGEGNEMGEQAGMDAAKTYVENNFPAASEQYENSLIPLANLDNKNRIEFTKVVANQSQTTHYKNTGRKDYVYRAFAYMKDSNGVTISKPVYYTYYDIAMIENGKSQSQGLPQS